MTEIRETKHGVCGAYARPAPLSSFVAVTGAFSRAIPAQYERSRHAPEPRTLIDILYDTAARHPDAPAIDDGEVQLTYAEMITDIEDSVDWLAALSAALSERGR